MSKQSDADIIRQLNEQWSEEKDKPFELYKNVEPNHNEVKNRKPQYINIPENRRNKSS